MVSQSSTNTPNIVLLYLLSYLVLSCQGIILKTLTDNLSISAHFLQCTFHPSPPKKHRGMRRGVQCIGPLPFLSTGGDGPAVIITAAPLSHGSGVNSPINPEAKSLHETLSDGEGANASVVSPLASEQKERTGFTHALFDSIIPRDVMNSNFGIARGDFTVEKKTLLYHAAASDEYSLFAKRRLLQVKKSWEGWNKKASQS
jgi:hypothetical protein